MRAQCVHAEVKAIRVLFVVVLFSRALIGATLPCSCVTCMALIASMLLCGCVRSTANVSDFRPDEVQNEKGWRYYRVGFTDEGAVESVALSESAGRPIVAWRLVRLLSIGVRTKVYFSAARDEKLRQWDDATLIFKNVYDDPFYASDLSLADLDGTPALSFYGTRLLDGGENALFYAHSVSADHTAWSAPAVLAETGDAQFGCTLLNVDGAPAIQYVESRPAPANSRHNIRYLRAADALGDSWSTPVDVYMGAWSAQSRPSMAIVSGNPAVCFAGRHTINQDGEPVSAGNLSYVRALDPRGENWGTALILDLSPGAGEFVELAQIGAHPAAYYRIEPVTPGPVAPYEMRYLPALDSTGFSWGTPRFLGTGNGWQVVDIGGRAFASNGIVPQQSQLGGSPYLTGRISADGSGSKWSEEQFLDYTEQVGVHDLALLGGRPAIVYIDHGAVSVAVFHF